MLFRLLLSFVVLCICTQVRTVPLAVDSTSDNRDLDEALHLPPLAGVSVEAAFSVESAIAPIEAYQPLEYVGYIDDTESFGELQITDTDLEGPEHESVITDLVDKTKALLVKIKEYIVSKVRGVINTINKIEVHAKVIIDAGSASFKRKLDAVVQKAREGIKKKVAELKKDAKACLADSEKKFKEMLKNFLIGEEHCVTDEFHKAFDIAKNTKNAILTAITKVTGLPGEITNCLKGNDKLTCIKKGVWDVAKAEEQSFKTFVTQFATAASFVTGFESRVANCALDTLGKAGVASFDIVEKFPECVINKALKTK